MIRVLIVDDDIKFCRTLRETLHTMNGLFDVVASAFDGRTALAYMRAFVPDAAIVDLILPGPLNGIAVIETIRFERPAAVIIGITGMDDPGLCARAAEAGADIVLQKDEYLKAIRSALSAVDPHGEVY